MDPTRTMRAYSLHRLPRAGGDGPFGRGKHRHRLAAPPRRRGWTARRPAPSARPRGSPAQAGMDLVDRADDGIGARLPRAGGDGPAARVIVRIMLLAPPRRRGWTAAAKNFLSEDPGSPAQAGMDPSARAMNSSSGGLPRAGGDGPSAGCISAGGSKAPPRRRGWTPTHPSAVAAHDGSPAQAGMDPTPRTSAPSRARLPRAGGDGPCDTAGPEIPAAAPPRRRGWTRLRGDPRRQPPGSPAQAGMDPSRRSPTGDT